MATAPSTTLTVNRSSSLFTTVLISWFLGFFALGTAGAVGDYLRNASITSDVNSYLIQGVIMSGIILFGVLLMRRKMDQGFPMTIGIGNARHSFIRFLLGMSIFIVPLIISLAVTYLFDLAVITFNFQTPILEGIGVSLLTVFLFEAFPEELLFRGYIFSNLNTGFQRWKASLITVGLFVLLPVLLVPVQKYLLGMDIYVGGNSYITPGYLINMFLFGSFVLYLRIVTNSIWTGIGFHLMFVAINRMVGLESTNLIQFSSITNETPVQISLLASLLLIFVALMIYPKWSGKSLHWNKKMH